MGRELQAFAGNGKRTKKETILKGKKSPAGMRPCIPAEQNGKNGQCEAGKVKAGP